MTWKVVFNFENGKYVKLILMSKARRDRSRTFGKILQKTIVMMELLHAQFYTFDFLLFSSIITFINFSSFQIYKSYINLSSLLPINPTTQHIGCQDYPTL